MKMTLRRNRGTGVVKRDGQDTTMLIIRALGVSSKSLETAIRSIGEVVSHYEIWHERHRSICGPKEHVDLTQGQLIDLRDAVKVAKRNIELCDDVIGSLVYLSGVTIIEENEPDAIESKKEKTATEEND